MNYYSLIHVAVVPIRVIVDVTATSVPSRCFLLLLCLVVFSLLFCLLIVLLCSSCLPFILLALLIIFFLFRSAVGWGHFHECSVY